MQLCLAIIPDSDVMFTVALSDPMLIEGASCVMSIDPRYDLAGVLAYHLQQGHISKGD